MDISEKMEETKKLINKTTHNSSYSLCNQLLQTQKLAIPLYQILGTTVMEFDFGAKLYVVRDITRITFKN